MLSRTVVVIVIAIVIAIGGFGCRNKSGTSTGNPSGSGSAGAPASKAQPDPWNTDAKPVVPESAETRRQRAEAALARVASISPKLEKIRSLPLKREIPREYQSTADFQKFVKTEIAKELPVTKAADLSEALFHVGMLKKQGNVAELLEQAFTTQAGAYYDPAQQKFFLVMVPDSELVLDTISAHELTHGLQDQHFDLRAFLPEPAATPALDDDERTARQFLVEGDATFTMFLFALSSITKTTEFDPELLRLLRSQLADFAAKSPQELIKENAASFSAMDPEIKKSIDAMNDIPMTLLVPMISSYTYGAQLVAAAFEKGGWAGVNALYAHPPQSTEQALHPMEKLLGRPDRPQKVALGKTAGVELANLVFGELQWQVYFQLWAPDVRAVASEGWDGDRVSVHRRPDGRVVARIATVWDTSGDAQEFLSAYQASLSARFPGAVGDPEEGGFVRPGNVGAVFARRAGRRVFIVDGADSAKELDALMRMTIVK